MNIPIHEPIEYEDSLSHDDVANAVIKRLSQLPPGSIAAIQAPWGRGKSDILRRVYAKISMGETDCFDVPPLSVNPWEYQTPDLLTPLVCSIISRIPVTEESSLSLKTASAVVLQAGFNFGRKAIANFLPGGELFKLASDEAVHAAEQLIALRRPDSPDYLQHPEQDPTKALGENFAILIGLLQDASSTSKPIVICVDDLDRCSPGVQAGWLEALHFLATPRANCVIVLAIDTASATESISSHYNIIYREASKYIEKIIDEQIPLSELSTQQITRLVDRSIPKLQVLNLNDNCILKLYDNKNEPNNKQQFYEACNRVFIGDYRNPRFIRRILNTLHRVIVDTGGISIYLSRVRASIGGIPSVEYDKIRKESAAIDYIFLLHWLIICHKYPQVRHAFQHQGPAAASVVLSSIKEMLSSESSHATFATKNAHLRRIPLGREDPFLHNLFNSASNYTNICSVAWMHYEGQLVECLA